MSVSDIMRFQNYCRAGDVVALNKLLFLLPKSKIQRKFAKNKIDIHCDKELGFIDACSNGHFKMVK